MAKSPIDSRLLALPRELRDEIYYHYLVVEGGYVYDFESGKLGCVTPAGARKPIDLALMLSCQQIAQEMQGLALKTNTITFTSVSPPAKRGNIRHFEKYMGSFWDRAFQCLQEKDFNHPLRQSERDWRPVPNFDDSVYTTVANAFPKFEPHLRIIRTLAFENHRLGTEHDAMMQDGIDWYFFNNADPLRKRLDWENYWGEVPSLQRQAVLETLRLISARGCWSGKAWESVEEGPGAFDYRVPTPDLATSLLRYHSLYKPWTIVEDDVIHDINADIHHPAHFRSLHCTEEEYERDFLEISRGTCDQSPNSYYLTAASIAIHFLESIPAQRRNIRNIILDEMHPCRAYSECHGLGFIEFCKENPDLRIERRANLWRSIFQSNRHGVRRMGHIGINQHDITGNVARWVIEALALVPAGMPPGSFTLVLDGNPAPEQSTQFFQRIHRDAAWQTALGESFDRGILPKPAYHDRRRMEVYIYEDFPQALKDISRGTCRAVRANFDVGESWDVEAVIEAHREWKLVDWEREWDLDFDYQTAPPLPAWDDLRRELRTPHGGTPWCRNRYGD